jgi:hypothetical protein
MSFRDKLRSKFDVKVVKVQSRAKTIEEQITDTLSNQMKMANGETVLGANGKPMTSWRSDKGEVSIRIGVLPMFLNEEGKSETYVGVSMDDYKSLLNELKTAYESGELSSEVADLKERKAAADKKAAEQRAKNKKKKTENRDGLS